MTGTVTAGGAVGDGSGVLTAATDGEVDGVDATGDAIATIGVGAAVVADVGAGS